MNFASDWSKLNRREGVFTRGRGKFDSIRFNEFDIASLRIYFGKYSNSRSLSTWAWRVPRNRSMARNFLRSINGRLLKRREAAIAIGKNIGAAAVRPPEALSTACSLQPRPSAAPKQRQRCRRTVFRCAVPPKTRGQPPHSCTAVAPPRARHLGLRLPT